MKVRQGFVSNSSSSSFVCEVSGAVESGMDASPADLGFCTCENGHTFSQEFLVGITDVEDLRTRYDMEDDEYEELSPEEKAEADVYEGSGYNIPAKYCPICQMVHISRDDVFKLLVKDSGLTQDQYMESVKARFGTYEKLKEYLK